MVRAVIRVPGFEEATGGGAAAAAAAVAPPGPAAFAGSSSASGSASRLSTVGKVPSLVFEMEDDDGHGSQHGARDGSPFAPDATDVVQRLQALLEPWSEAEYMLLLHVRFAREDAAKRGCVSALPDLADTLRRLGYSVKMRTALGGGGGGACLRNLRHQFLSVTIQSPGGGSVDYVVDPRFREQFEIAHATPRYSAVLAGLGPELVATPDRLHKVVELLCSELSRAFAETGTPLPPWRQHTAMLSKWQPRRSEEVAVSAAARMSSNAGLQAPQDTLRQQHGDADGAAANGNGVGLVGVGRRKVAPLTGPATIAQRLAMLGVQAPSRVSPVAEGLEALSEWSSASLDGSPGGGSTPEQDGSDGGGGRRGGSGRAERSGSLHLGSDSEEEDQASGRGVPTPTQACQTPLAKVHSANLAVPAAALAVTAAAGVAALNDDQAAAAAGGGAALHADRRHVWAGIKRAVAALPQRRNTWA